MKTMKTLMCGVMAAAACAVCAPSAKAVTLVNFSPVNFSFTVRTNISKDTVASDNVSLGTAKLVNKDILNILSKSEWFDGSLSGDRLVIAWDSAYFGRLVVINANNDIVYEPPISGDPEIRVEFGYDEGSSTQTDSNKEPGSWNATFYNTGYFYLYDDVSSYTDLYGYGASTEHFTDSWNASDDLTKWSDSEHFTPQGAAVFLDSSSVGTLTGTITASGHGTTYPGDLPYEY